MVDANIHTPTQSAVCHVANYNFLAMSSLSICYVTFFFHQRIDPGEFTVSSERPEAGGRELP